MCTYVCPFIWYRKLFIKAPRAGGHRPAGEEVLSYGSNKRVLGRIMITRLSLFVSRGGGGIRYKVNSLRKNGWVKWRNTRCFYIILYACFFRGKLEELAYFLIIYLPTKKSIYPQYNKCGPHTTPYVMVLPAYPKAHMLDLWYFSGVCIFMFHFEVVIFKCKVLQLFLQEKI